MEDQYAKIAVPAINDWCELYNTIEKNECLLDKLSGWEYSISKVREDGKKLLLRYCFADLILCEQHLGHDPLAASSESLLVKYAYYKKFANDVELDAFLDFCKDELYEFTQRIVGNNCVKRHSDTLKLNLAEFLEGHGLYSVCAWYYDILIRFSNAIAVADNNISLHEDLWLMLLSRHKQLCESKADEIKKNKISEIETCVETTHKADEFTEVVEITQEGETETTEETTAHTNPIDELFSLIGLDKVKSDVSNLNNLLKMQKLRQSRGMKTAQISYHCVFTGNPGTGKTTVARILAGIYKELGILKKGHLIETDRSGLVADYVGQTATKTNEIIDKAIDGVLFIDEAYSLVQGGQNDYGKEAISTLLKRMEDDRDKLIVILAGYNKEMEDFICSNSGLQSRFSRYIDFPDYTANELVEIYKRLLVKNELKATDEALEYLIDVITNAVNFKDSKFGNARFIRNLFEATITEQANRLSVSNSITDEELSTIQKSDIVYEMKENK